MADAHTTQKPAPPMDEPRRPLKRQRVSQACSTCRDRKTRCDGRQPVCIACEQRGVASECKFDGGRRTRSSQSQARLDPSSRPEYAEPIARSDAAQALSDLGKRPHQGHVERKRSAPPSSGLPTPSVDLPYNYGSNLGRRPSRVLTNSTWSGAKSDGLATIAAENDNSMYGPSSTVALLKQIMPKQTRQDFNTSERVSANGIPSRSSAGPERLPAKTEGLAVLPRRGQADNFVFCFWEFVHPLFPVLHWPTFTQKYEQLWTESDLHSHVSDEIEEAVFSATLNLVFALGCKFSNSIDPSQKEAVSDDFYQRSRQSYPFEILDSASFALVQMLVLTGVYLQSTERASRCWNTVGLAIRMAQSLGLHVNHSGDKAISQLHLQMRYRIWHACIHLDRLLSMTFGRPSMIDQRIDVPIPALIDDEYLSDVLGSAGVQPRDEPSRLGLFISSCKLFVVLEEILDLFNRNYPGSTSERQVYGATETSQLLEPVLTLNRKLDHFGQNLDEYLRVPMPDAPTTSTANHVHLQQQVLYCRFLYVRLLSLRPVLLMSTRRELRSASNCSLDDDVIQSCCTRCIIIACQLVDTLHNNLGTLYRSSGWHTVYFTFTSAIVLLASSKIEDVRSTLAGVDIEGTWERVYTILEHYENQIQSASQASRILKTMKSRTSDVWRTQGQFEHGIGRQNSMANSQTVPDQTPLMPTVTTAETSDFGQYLASDAEFYPSVALDELNISDSWFGQHLVNLDWLELAPV